MTSPHIEKLRYRVHYWRVGLLVGSSNINRLIVSLLVFRFGKHEMCSARSTSNFGDTPNLEIGLPALRREKCFLYSWKVHGVGIAFLGVVEEFIECYLDRAATVAAVSDYVCEVVEEVLEENKVKVDGGEAVEEDEEW
ncbi:hypothetical protein L6452_43943 [Arctium lappa]|uniref:Uncharacterized protein n=1 Tax=Arctium lappa TaxID=4217 RepID=A0ACB8XG53_ARCLA|nr:hypothetical protein L6452_43943 [Arctium lappa]